MWSLLMLTFILLSVNPQPNSRYEDHTVKDLTSHVQKGTCHNNCGSFTACSCRTNCRIHGTCCKDFEEACPSMASNAQVEFQQFVELIQECEFHNFLLVSTCPSKAEEQLHPGQNQTDQNVIPISTTLRNITNGQGLDARLFRSSPITDLDSGFTFKNASIYLCNKLPGKNLLFWDIYLETIQLDERGILFFESLSKIVSISFPPLELTRSSKNTLCIYDFEMSPDFGIVEKKNSSRFMTPLLRGYESLCRLCDWSFQQSSSLEKKDISRCEFSVIASLEYDKVKFSGQEPGGHNSLPWQEIHCPIVETKMEQNGSRCHIISCYESFQKISSSRCQGMYILQIAIPHDGRSIGNNFLNKLPNFLECFLNQYSGYNVKNRWPVSELFYDTQSQQVYYATQLQMYSDNLIAVWNSTEFMDHLSRLAKAITFLKAFRRSNVLEYSKTQLAEQARAATFKWDGPRTKNIKPLSEHGIELVCANIKDKEKQKFPAFYTRTFHCDNVPVLQSYNVTEQNDTEKNICQNFFEFSGQSRNRSSRLILMILILYHFFKA
ncbi:hypothetical protein BgiBS90_027146 [Biomphalaria glabrata]|nr:hypothetical protein BgiBS90_027146 [Biomphalaria glabrata]